MNVRLGTHMVINCDTEGSIICFGHYTVRDFFINQSLDTAIRHSKRI